jgi:hypothetical protein
VLFRRRKRYRPLCLTQKLDIVIDFVNVPRRRESDADRLDTIPDDCLADAQTVRGEVSVEFLKRLHSLEDTRG